MRYFLIIVLFLCGQIKAQTITWTTGNEAAVKNYVVEAAQDTNKIWTALSSVTKGKTSYTVQIPNESRYYRVHAVRNAGSVDFFTKARLLTAEEGNEAVISDWSITQDSKTDNIKFTVDRESGVTNYEITRSYDAINFKTCAYDTNGLGEHSVLINKEFMSKKIKHRWWFFTWYTTESTPAPKALIRITAKFNDGTSHVLKTLSE